MNCDQARQRWHDRFDEDRDDPALDSHLNSCEKCRRYAGQMSRIVDVLDELRNETESMVPRQTEGRADRSEVCRRRAWRIFLWPATGIAAAVVIAITASLFYLVDRNGIMVNPVVPLMEIPPPRDTVERSSVSPRLGISLRGESAQRFLAVEQPVSQDNVQVFWLYPAVASASKGGPQE